jgi:preprotein translocase subunit SecG
MVLKVNSKRKWILFGVLFFCIMVALVIIWSHRSSSEISETKFVDVYVQLSLANEFYATDSLKLREEKEKIFRQAQVTPKEMDSFVKERKQKPEQWESIWKKILEKLESNPQAPKSP